MTSLYISMLSLTITQFVATNEMETLYLDSSGSNTSSCLLCLPRTVYISFDCSRADRHTFLSLMQKFTLIEVLSCHIGKIGTEDSVAA